MRIRWAFLGICLTLPPKNCRASANYIIYPTNSVCPSHSLRKPMKEENVILLGHINELRRLTVEASTATVQYESAVLLLDIYEQMLQNVGLMDFGKDETKH
jgi:hypothetical protein